MLALPATSSATPSVQRTLLATRLAQVQQAAQQAESEAKTLQTQADAADQEARSQRQSASSLRQQLASQDTTYAPAQSRRKGVSNPARTGLLLDVWAG